MLDYGELFCEAVDTIVKERLNNIAYDRTILCTIEDDERRELGVYIVSENGSAKFEAYSNDTTYRKGNNVYVQIPGGDWNQQKTIISKKTDDTVEPHTYIKPFSQLVDVTGNVISGTVRAGLIANSGTYGASYDEDELQATRLWSYNATDDAIAHDDGVGFTGYTRLGIQAGFQSWLTPYTLNEDDPELRNVIQGEYGLCLRIGAIPQVAANDIPKEELDWYDLYLNQEDMNGNPYDFNTFFTQEKVFDISSLGTIQTMELIFYQVPLSFSDGTLDKDGNPNYLPWQDFLGNLVKPNLYVNDVYVTFGYDVKQFEDEMIQIYNVDSSTYYENESEPEVNHKNLKLRWIHKDDNNKFKSIVEDNNMEFEVRWYRYNLGASSADEYSGLYWSYLSTQKVNIDNSKDGIIRFDYEILDKSWNEYNTTNINTAKYPDFLETWILPDVSRQEEQIKAVLIYRGQVYRSNVLYLTNEKEVANQATINAESALTIHCDDNTFGNYRIYHQGNSLINPADSKIVRTFSAMFKATPDAEPQIVTEAQSIEWIIPKRNTMIDLDETWISGGDVENLNPGDDQFYHIKRYGYGRKATDLGYQNRHLQKYRVAPYYSQNYSNNTITCKVVKNNITYIATKELTFGPKGSQGTDSTLILDFDNGVTAVTNEKDKAVTVTARLYDSENNEIIDLDKNENLKWTWGWKNGDSFITLAPIKIEETDRDSNRVELKLENILNDKQLQSNFNILQVTLEGWGDYDLTAYLPIPIRKTENYLYLNGTTQVLYSTTGELMEFYRTPYELYEETGLVQNTQYDIYNGVGGYEKTNDINIRPLYQKDTEGRYYELIGEPVEGVQYYEYKIDERYTPKIDTNFNYLVPVNFFIETAYDKICVIAFVNDDILWSQPILITQNTYPSAMLNAWDGKLQINEEDNSILAASMAAGKKNEDNTFTGVVMGALDKTETENKLAENIGVYGIHEGKVSFALKEDGTATFGKSGKGQIHIDGNNSIITSENYLSGNQGMKIDLDDGIIDIKDYTGNKKSQIQLKPESPYLQIISNQGNTLINIADNNYYLQSDNQNLNNGTKLNLNNGVLDLKSPYGKITFNANYDGNNTENYFSIAVPGLNNNGTIGQSQTGDYPNELFKLNSDNYFLQSIGYSPFYSSQIDITVNGTIYKGCNVYNNGKYCLYTQSNGNILVFQKNDNGIWSEKTTFPSVNENFTDDEGVSTILGDPKTAFISTLTPVYVKSSSNSGLKLDLHNGVISGYDLRIYGQSKTNSENTFVVDCSNATTPLNIGNKFKVNWDGSLTCSNLKSLTNTNSTNYPFHINGSNGNFYIDSTGKAYTTYLKSSSGSYSGSHYGSGSFGSGLSMLGSQLGFKTVYQIKAGSYLQSESSESGPVLRDVGLSKRTTTIKYIDWNGNEQSATYLNANTGISTYRCNLYLGQANMSGTQVVGPVSATN